MRRLDGQSVSRDAHIVKHRELKSSALEKVRASAYGLPRRKKELDNTGVRTSAPGDGLHLAESYFPHADAPGLAPVRRGCCVVLLTSQKVSVSPQVKRTASRPRLRTHGRLTHRRNAFGLVTEPSAPLPANVSRENTLTARFVRPLEGLHPARRA